MNFRIPAAFLVISVLLFSACCSSKTGTGGGKLKDEKQQERVQSTPPASDTLHKQTSGGGPTAIKENSSIITGEIVDKKIQGENDFELMVMVKASDETDYENLIVKGMVYQMKPAFIEENGKIQPIEKNKKLLELKDLPKGSTFRARVSLTDGNRCIIQDVLDK